MPIKIIPQVQPEPLLLDESGAEAKLRREDADFIRRGRAAIERSVKNDDGVPAEEVIAMLQAKVDAARSRRAKAK